ncbi:pyridoxamine 5'-phosphate oxidase family protein [Nocardioides campestrisoli]|uniref:pyridoxamine 5'-phosphate oxidase family protein n=1 Tax=Nocardioides campestrisoli TaxID=2736757 RepID=UPI0015E6B3C1|nr:pyridoxamine 5'-phosphate oxidase family protein [Nocardioides campestrisoli]
MDDVVELSPDECRELLGRDVVGRVAFTTPRGPRIVPVNYTVGADAVAIRTTAYSELATYAPGTSVAFEIDHLDRALGRGWSVIVLGHCERGPDQAVVGAGTGERAESPEPWAGGHRTLLLRISLDEVTGRRVGGDRWPHPVVAQSERRD